MIHAARPLAFVLVATAASPALAQAPGDPAGDTTTGATLTVDASAQFAPVPPPPPVRVARVAVPAPQNEDWNNVSHINGTPVKVGERNDYLNDGYKKVNISSNPIGWMFGFYGVSGSYAIHKNVAIRGDANLFN